jgi:hypothetical protein
MVMELPAWFGALDMVVHSASVLHGTSQAPASQIAS